MTAHSLTADEVALFLRDNPSFFQEHAEIFAELRVPHPHETRAISLGERQIMTLRAKTKDLEWKLSGLINNASGNEKISRTLTAWCARMLAEPDTNKLPQHIVSSLSSLFELPNTALRIWGFNKFASAEFTDGVTDSIKAYALSLETPYCGPVEDHPVASWLAPEVQSIAVVPLKANETQQPIGLLVFGSESADHFTADMGTAFLEIIGDLSAAALTRLLPQS